VNAGGGVGATSAPYALVIQAPAAPVIAQPAKLAINWTMVTFSGTSTEASGAKVQVDAVSNAAAVACTATIQANQSWSCTSRLDDGNYALAAAVIEAAGPLGPASPARTLLVDTIAPAAPSLESPRTPNNSSHVSLRGAGEAGPTVTVSEGATPVC